MDTNQENNPVDPNDYVNQLTLNFLISKTQLNKLNKLKQKEFDLKPMYDKDRITNLFNKLLNNNKPDDLLEDVQTCFDAFIEKSIYYLEIHDKNADIQNERNDFEEDKQDEEEENFGEDEEEDFGEDEEEIYDIIKPIIDIIVNKYFKEKYDFFINIISIFNTKASEHALSVGDSGTTLTVLKCTWIYKIYYYLLQ